MTDIISVYGTRRAIQFADKAYQCLTCAKDKKIKNQWVEYTSKVGAKFKLELKMNYLAGVIVMAFTFGSSIPLMFPLAFISVFLHEICLRYQLARQY